MFKFIIRTGLVATLTFGFAVVANAATYEVNTIADDLICDASSCSLRGAMHEAGSTPENDVITFADPSAIYTLTDGEIMIYNHTNTGSLTISGNGESNTIINGNDNERIFEVLTDAVVNISDVTLKNGRADVRNNYPQDSQGGAIYSNGLVTLNRVIVSYNFAGDFGGGIYSGSNSELIIRNSTIFNNVSLEGGGGIVSTETLKIRNSTIEENHAQLGGGGISNYGYMNIYSSVIEGNTSASGGGGIDNSYQSMSPLATSLIQDSIIQNNHTIGCGGGVLNSHIILTINNTDIENNSADYGGGVYTYGTGDLSISNSRIEDNSATYGGGIHIDRDAPPTRILDTIIKGNSADSGGGIYMGVEELDLNLIDSAVTDNTATDQGGGLYIYGDIVMTNTTVSGNTSGTEGGGIMIDGDYKHTINLSFSTIAYNNAGDSGGGIYATSSNSYVVNVKGTILSDNTSTDGPNCMGNLNSSGYNIISDMAMCNFTSTANDYIVDPLLELLADNGGDTYTHAITFQSPAYNRVPANRCRSIAGITLSTDQRGSARPYGVTCDIGAYESQSAR